MWSVSAERRALEGALSILWEGWGSHEVSVLADAGPQKHQAPIFSSVKWGRVRSSPPLLCFTLPEEEKLVEGWEGEQSRKAAAPFSPSSGQSPGLSRVRKEQIPSQL